MRHRWLPAPLALLVTVGACAPRPEPRIVDGVAYGFTAEPFRKRWWLYYERGLSWADGGFLAEAETDLRACLRLRATDRRRARTYGMHYVHCFAHRELGAVLLAQGRLDEAEHELRLSMEQEPNAKAALLLARLHAVRTGAPAAGPAAGQIALLGAVPEPPIGHLRIDEVTTVGPAEVEVRGSAGAAGLWVIAPGGPPLTVRPAPDGSFTVRVPVQARLAVGRDAKQAMTVRLEAVGEPELRLDGPADGDAPTTQEVVFRWQAASPRRLRELVATCDGREHLRQQISGVRATGMLPLALPVGSRRLAIRIEDEAGATREEVRSLDVRPVPEQERTIRATALLVPPQPVRRGSMLPTDQPRLVEALSLDARFRIEDRDADRLLARELGLDGGWVDDSTVASAGLRMRCRYAIAATINRHKSGIECFVRLVHCHTGLTVASADAYAEGALAADAPAFFRIVAARVRQSFPVLSGQLVHGEDGSWVDIGSRHGVCALMLFYADFAGQRRIPLEIGRRERARSRLHPPPHLPDGTRLDSE